MAEQSSPWLVVGLGNPGPEYGRHRHNVGFMIAEVLAGRVGVRLARSRKVAAQVGEGRLGVGGPRVVLVQPMTFMNLSGGPVASLARFYTVPIEAIIAVHDDLDIPFGQVRLKVGGGEGGHNGLRSMSKSLASKDYLRVRFGIGRPPGRQDPADYVLSNFSAVERKELDFLVDRAADAVEAILHGGLAAAQNTYHAS